VTNYGMNPLLGKYYTTVCQDCFTSVTYGTTICPSCQSKKIINGVFDRIETLNDDQEHPDDRPSYVYQAPLEYVKGLGPKTFEKLLTTFGTEMNVIHNASEVDLRKVVKGDIVDQI